jgi:uncharacterized membrane protein YqaE (UPF0057 family)
MPRCSAQDVGLTVVAIFLPPLAVFIKKNACDGDVLINCLLTLLGWIPGKSSGPRVCDQLLQRTYYPSLDMLQALSTRSTSFSSTEMHVLLLLMKGYHTGVVDGM